MRAPLTNDYAEVAVAHQCEIAVRAVHDEVELGQERDGEWNSIYLQPENVLTLIAPCCA